MKIKRVILGLVFILICVPAWATYTSKFQDFNSFPSVEVSTGSFTSDDTILQHEAGGPSVIGVGAYSECSNSPSGGKCVRATYPNSDSTNTLGFFNYDPPSTTEIYVSFYVRFDSNWHSPFRHKWLWFHGLGSGENVMDITGSVPPFDWQTGGCSSAHGFFMQFPTATACGGGEPPCGTYNNPTPQRLYDVRHITPSSCTTQDYPSPIWADYAPGGSKAGQWMHFEWYQKLNTVGQDNGIGTMWIDGVQVQHRTNVRWRSNSAVWTAIHILRNWTGSNDFSDPNTEYIDDLCIANSLAARTNGSCNSGPSPNPPTLTVN